MFPGADPGAGRYGARPPLGRSFTIQNALFNSIQPPVHHWAPPLGEILYPPLVPLTAFRYTIN